MTRPVILAVDDPKVLRADPAEAALAALDKPPSGDPVALSLVTWSSVGRPPATGGGRARLN